jgi:CheY-like chemotaxis protein
LKKVVLIDDDADELDLLREAIDRFYGPVECLSFEDPEAALKSIMEHIESPPDVIFIDINMPKLTGDMCLQVIRTELRLETVIIAIMSTTMEPENTLFLIRKGADFAFKKPYETEGYRQVVSKVLSFNKSTCPDKPGSFF